VLTSNPRFQWTADEGLVGGIYGIRVAPADGAASPEEAMQAFPSWDAPVSSTTALYPGGVTAIPLAPGRTYAWQITREVRTSGGTAYLSSPIYWFKMAGGDDAVGPGRQPGAGDLGAALRLEALARALGLGSSTASGRPVR
jgi:hypothetical protein